MDKKNLFIVLSVIIAVLIIFPLVSIAYPYENPNHDVIVHHDINIPKQFNLTIIYKNGTNPVSGQQFKANITYDGRTQTYTGITSANGSFTFRLPQAGQYKITTKFYNYSTSTIIKNVTGSTYVNDNVALLKDFNYTVELRSFPLNGNESVNIKGFTISRYGEDIKYNVQSNNSGTFFNFKAPQGNYTFTYNNKHYVSTSFIKYIHSNGTFVKNITAYLLNVSSNLSVIYNGVNVTNNNTFLASAGLNSLNVYYGNILVKVINIDLNSTNPYKYLSITDANASVQLTQDVYTVSNNITTVTYNTTSINGVLIKFNFPYDLNNSSISVNGKTIAFNVNGNNYSPNSGLYENGPIKVVTKTPGIISPESSNGKLTNGMLYYIKISYTTESEVEK
ncbi:hypothetical protein [Acidiplasma aeolicum]|uniref:Uncharacterized protein n=1 Tax=Acidiplasma aeolicum TaxID=507754 RepID=A0A0Q1B149_9ARCH|nr:hypothetical protein [Acidiplasma aeolicum]KQB33457.1 hypothetical protein AOG54_07030 [Acidiplasma aeolicum]